MALPEISGQLDPVAPSPRLKLFVADVQYCYKWLSTWVIGVAALAPMLLEMVPALHGVLSPSAEHYLETVLALLAFVARIANQAPKRNEG